MSNEDQTLVDVEYLGTLESQLAEANRTIAKTKTVLEGCYNYFNHKAAMNAAQHMAHNVLASPLESSISSTLNGISIYEKVWLDGGS